MRSLSLALLLPLAAAAGCAHRAASSGPSPTAMTEAAAAPPVATTPDAPFRAQKPAPLPSEPAFKPPIPTQLTLKNGAKLLVVENHQVPIVAVEIDLQSGIDEDPLDKRGLSGFVAQMLLEGTKSRSAIDLEIARERLAAQLSTDSGNDTSSLRLNALKDTLPEALALLADVLLHPAFQKTDVDRVRGLALTALQAKKGSAGALARDDFNHLLWGPQNPWGLPSGGTVESLKAITAKDLVAFHRTFYVPNNAVISVSGDITPTEAATAIEAALAGWKSHALPHLKKPSYPAPTARSIAFTNLPTASQSQVWTGWRGPKASDAAALPLLVANNVLGGIFTSRLNLNLREQKAFSYGVQSRVSFFRDVGVITAAGGIVAVHTAEAVVEFERELKRLGEAPPSDEEIDRAKQAIIRGLPSRLETNDAVAGSMAALIEQGLPLDYYVTLPANVLAVQKSAIAEAVAKFVVPEQWPVVVVGPKDKCFDALEALKIGPVVELPTQR